ncbi:F-box and WD-40 domain-containing protein 1/11 [Exophiala viscosa]|uniref:F-box and WD-40 domain-containing protein 1/11 n=1 Tax=Exophiala viscosa TaxID=2486360 RepID=UPI00219F7B46|nr:F-box and WD-40 domain-containing protein 1/11 [Exophiala viscosa]
MDPSKQSTFTSLPSPYASGSTHAPFRLDEGFSEDTSSQDENGRNMFDATAARFQEWVMAQNEDARAEIAYEVLRTLRTSNIAAVVDRLTPLLHMDPIEKLPAEITSQMFSYLDANTLLIASLASQTWRARIVDPMLWLDLYESQGWAYDRREVRAFEHAHNSLIRNEFKKSRGQFHSQPTKKRVTMEWLESKGRKLSADVSQWREQHGVIEADTDIKSEPEDMEMHDAPNDVQNSPPRPNKRSSQESGDEMDYYSSPQEIEYESDRGKGKAVDNHTHGPRSQLAITGSDGRERLNWLHLYMQRQKLEHNWTKGLYSTFQLPHPDHPNEAHTECVYTIQFFGKWLVSGSRDKTLRVWDLETRRLRGKPLVGHSQSVLCLQFDPTEDEDIIISGSSDASVLIWKFSTGQKLHEIPSAHEESVLNLKFDKRYLVTCSKDRRIRIWNRRHLTATDPDYPKVSKHSSAKVPSYIVNTTDMDPSLLEARLPNGTIRALKPYMLLLTLEGHNAAVNAIQISGDLIVSASGDRLIKVWNARNGKLLRTLQGHQKGIACVQFDSKRVVSGSSDNTVRIYDPYTGAEVAELKGHNNLVRTIQAGFGDLPGCDEDDNLRAREAERKYLERLTNGKIVEDRQYRREIRNGDHGSSRLALGAKLPPGGGGSKWGRIVSGSYDQTIIIWRKNAEGHWVIGKQLRQEAHGQETATARQRSQAQTADMDPQSLPASQPTSIPNPAVPQVHSAPANLGPAGAAHPAAMSASQIVQQAVGTSFASLGAGLTNVMGIGRVLNPPITGPRNGASQQSSFSSSSTISGTPQSIASAAAAHTQALVSQSVQQALNQAALQRSSSRNQTGGQNQSQTIHVNLGQPLSAASATAGSSSSSHGLPQVQGQAQVNVALHPQVAAAQQQQQHQQAQHQQAAASNQGQQGEQQSSVSRVFKLQFDARRIVCCSQDSRIVGWDFANGDPDVIEASRFFIGP